MQVPRELIQSLFPVKGFNQQSFEQAHETGQANISIRVNRQKFLPPPETLFAAEQPSLEMTPVPWSSDGFYLSARPSFTLQPLFHAGAFYVQEASSMFLEQALRQSTDLQQPLKILDLCAAPGGKSTLIQSLLTADGLLVSNEVIKSRVSVLAENITKWGRPNVIVTNNDPRDFQRLPGWFDVIVVDAPCSGSGLFIKDAQAVDEWSSQAVDLCSQRQRRILADILPSLKPGGVLVYSTCSYSPEEDEEIIDWLMQQGDLSSMPLSTSEEWNIVETLSGKTNGYGYRFFPDRLKGEGFFLSVLKKASGENEKLSGVKQRPKMQRATTGELTAIKPWLKNAGDFFFVKQNGEVLSLPSGIEEELETLRTALYIKKAGINMGSIIRNELIPAHELAMSTAIAAGIPAVEVDRETALQYLRRQEVSLTTTHKGWALLTYASTPLGWVKILPNRINNYYPKEWRILHK